MHILVYILLFFLFTINKVDSKPQTQASQIKDPTELVREFNKLNQPESTPKECQYCLNYAVDPSETALTPEQESKLFQKCAVDLCGPANENPKYVYDNTAFDKEQLGPEITKGFNNRIRPIIEQAFQTRLEQDRNVLRAFGNKLKDPASNLSKREWDEMAEALSHGITGQSFTEEGWRYFVDEENLPPGSKRGVRSYVRNKNNMAASSVLLRFMTIPYKQKDEFLEEQYQGFLNEYKKNKTKFTKEEREKVAQLDQMLTDKSSLDHYSFSKTLDNLIKKNKDISFCTEEDCRRWVQNELRYVYWDLEDATSDDGKEKHLNEQLAHCESVNVVNIKHAQQAGIYRENLDDISLFKRICG